jgi:1-acyl-sn-glycerol-3-phosphate acyltransferase
VFVSKSEVKDWPLFGWFARRAGTIFIDRRRRSDAAKSGCAMQDALRQGLLVVLFPEGTSSDGSRVLPFRSALFEPAIDPRAVISVAHLSYRDRSGNTAAHVPYWGDMVLLPHLLRLLAQPSATSNVRFAYGENTLGRDRKSAAARSRERILEFKAQKMR